MLFFPIVTLSVNSNDTNRFEKSSGDGPSSEIPPEKAAEEVTSTKVGMNSDPHPDLKSEQVS